MEKHKVTVSVVDRVSKATLFEWVYSLRRVPKMNDTVIITQKRGDDPPVEVACTVTRVHHVLITDEYRVFCTKN